MITRWPIRSVRLVLHGLRCGVNIRRAARAACYSSTRSDSRLYHRIRARGLDTLKRANMNAHIRELQQR